jgi:CheY-like chemotaxis protein
MSAETAAHIFEPFFTTKEPGKGTGLGLATVFGIVKQHRGAITVTTALGKGTSFRILLPTFGGGEFDAELAKDTAPRGGRETILVVEDDEGVRRLTKRLLERHGYTVIEAASGVQALRSWRERQGTIDLLLTDLVMPEGVSGRELAARLREERPGLKVLFTSGYSPDIAGQALVLEVGQSFLGKPFEAHALLDMVRRCIEG